MSRSFYFPPTLLHRLSSGQSVEWALNQLLLLLLWTTRETSIIPLSLSLVSFHRILSKLSYELAFRSFSNLPILIRESLFMVPSPHLVTSCPSWSNRCPFSLSLSLSLNPLTSLTCSLRTGKTLRVFEISSYCIGHSSLDPRMTISWLSYHCNVVLFETKLCVCCVKCRSSFEPDLEDYFVIKSEVVHVTLSFPLNLKQPLQVTHITPTFLLSLSLSASWMTDSCIKFELLPYSRRRKWLFVPCSCGKAKVSCDV